MPQTFPQDNYENKPKIACQVLLFILYTLMTSEKENLSSLINHHDLSRARLVSLYLSCETFSLACLVFQGVKEYVMFEQFVSRFSDGTHNSRSVAGSFVCLSFTPCQQLKWRQRCRSQTKPFRGESTGIISSWHSQQTDTSRKCCHHL